MDRQKVRTTKEFRIRTTTKHNHAGIDGAAPREQLSLVSERILRTSRTVHHSRHRIGYRHVTYPGTQGRSAGCGQSESRTPGYVTRVPQMSMQAYYDPPGIRTASGCGEVCLAMVEHGIAGRAGAAWPGPGGSGAGTGVWQIADSVYEAGHDITALVCVQVGQQMRGRAAQAAQALVN
jgi:hypothetical protein